MHSSDNGPPGPKGYPIVGNFPLLLFGNKSKLFNQLRGKYGDVFSLQLGSRRMVVINGYEALKEAFVKQADVFSERQIPDCVSMKTSKGKCLVRSSGHRHFLCEHSENSDLEKDQWKIKSTKKLDAVFTMDPLTIALCIVAVLFLMKLFHIPNNCPPGPPGYPVVGNFPLFLSSDRSKLFNQLRRKYGDVFSLQLGSRRMVVINGYEALKEAFVKQADVFSERPIPDYVSMKTSKGKGLIRSSGEFWKNTRTFSMRVLREFGFGKRSLENKILEEVSVFLEVIGKNNGDAFSLRTTAQISVSNVICSICFGERYAHDDENFQKLMWMIDYHFKLLSKAAVVIFLPTVRFLPGDIVKLEAISANFHNIMRFLRQLINKHRATFQKDNIRDFIDAFILEEMTQGKADYLDDDNLTNVVYALFLAGTETTSSTIKWAILFLICNTHVQTKLRQEINDVIGSSRAPSMTDKPEMPYTDAFIHETLRMANLAPLALFHAVKHDTVFRGYTIRKEDIVVPNLESALFEESLFEDPHTFNPERFIGEDGKLNGKEHTVLAFSLGRRVCFGESLARMELFLFLTSLVQTFELLPEDDAYMPSTEPVTRAVNHPQEFKFKAIKIN
ncbi:cytochrome P450 2B2-like [Argopecten irradians]|uniref:cytochrome P450 2B2-like n=1 Tax=Argopecten irradians TaxID=31199 RepID=UPI00371020D3